MNARSRGGSQVTEDYFYLCVKAIQTSMAVEMSERGKVIDAITKPSFGLKALYRKAIEDNVNFHDVRASVSAARLCDFVLYCCGQLHSSSLFPPAPPPVALMDPEPISQRDHHKNVRRVSITCFFSGHMPN